MTARPNKDGFTLIELLVVVAIIGVLVAMLLPAMNMARRHAKDMACQFNLRQLGLAVNMYADEWDEWIPPVPRSIANGWNTDINNAAWVPRLWPYVRSMIDATQRINDIKVGGVFVCPLDRNPVKEWGHMSSYYLWCGISEPGLQRRCRSSSPEYTTVLRDVQVFWHVQDFDLSALPIFPYWRDYGKGNFLFLDGHAMFSGKPPGAWDGWSWDQKMEWN